MNRQDRTTYRKLVWSINREARRAATEAGHIKYTPHLPCRLCGTRCRYVKTKRCVECRMRLNEKWRKNNQDHVNAWHRARTKRLGSRRAKVLKP